MTQALPARRRAPVLVAAAALAGLAADVALDPARRHVPLCPFHSATGLWCPLCGGLRAADALAHLQVRTALHDNVLLVAAAPALIAWWVAWLAGAGPVSGRGKKIAAGAIVTLTVAFGVARNLPIASALRPG